MHQLQKLKIAVIAACLLFTITMSAISQAQPKTDEKELQPRIDIAQENLNNVMQDTALWLDALATAEHKKEDPNNASAFGYLQLSWRPHRGDLDELAAKFKVHFHLPQWSDRFALILDNDPEDELQLDYESDPEGYYQTNDDINIAIQYFKAFPSGRRIKYRLGISRGELYSRAETSFQWQHKRLSVNLAPRVDYFSESGWGPGIKGAFTYSLKSSLLSLSASLQKVETEGKARAKVGIYHIKNLKSNGFIINGLEYNRDNKELDLYNNHNDSFLASLRYRNKIYKDWLHFEVEPYISFKQQRDYKAEYGLNFSFISYYGNHKKR